MSQFFLFYIFYDKCLLKISAVSAMLQQEDPGPGVNWMLVNPLINSTCISTSVNESGQVV